MTETQKEIESIEEKVIELLEANKVQQVIVDFINILQSAISAYQGELYSKNSEVGKLEYKIKQLEEKLNKKAT